MIVLVALTYLLVSAINPTYFDAGGTRMAIWIFALVVGGFYDFVWLKDKL